MSSTYTEKQKEITEEKGVGERLSEWQMDGCLPPLLLVIELDSFY